MITRLPDRRGGAAAATLHQLVRRTLMIFLGLLPLPKTQNPQHMKSNADVDFGISDEDRATQRNVNEIGDYGEHSTFPVFARART
jgi:diketogulonate reductase-like aldo/keto reductase